MHFVTILGFFGMALSTVSLLPQVIRTWRTKSAGDISAGWLFAALASMIIWIIYGTLMEAPAIVWANVLTFLQAGFILLVKLTFRVARELPAPPGD